MKNKIVLAVICLIGGVGSIFGQTLSDPVSCNLQNLAELTLEKNPTIQRQRLQVQRSKVSLQSAVSRFDYSLSASTAYDRNQDNLFQKDPRFLLADERIRANNLGVSGGLQRTFRSGLTANLGLNYSRISDNYPLNSFGEEVGSYFADNYTSTTFSLSQPLLRGGGRKYAAANEQAAEVDVESNRFNLIFVSSGELLNTVLGYWQYLYNYKSVEIYQQNEDRVQQVLEVTRDLVNAEKKPAGDLVQVQADLTDKQRQTLLARQQLFSAKQNLGRFIGLAEDESERLSKPLNDFPTVGESGYKENIDLEKLLVIARENRADLKALIKTRDALEITLGQARNNLKPQLDLGGFLSYGGVHAGNSVSRFATALGQTEGQNVQFGFSLNYLFPLNNNLAQANYISNEVSISDQQVILDNQIRNIELNVSIALNNLRNSILTLEKSGQSLAFYQQVFENEQTKFQNGLTTILNLILFQERLTFSQLDYLNSQQQFAQALINLRYETGTLLPANNTLTFKNDLRTYYELPDLN